MQVSLSVAVVLAHFCSLSPQEHAAVIARHGSRQEDPVLFVFMSMCLVLCYCTLTTHILNKPLSFLLLEVVRQENTSNDSSWTQGRLQNCIQSNVIKVCLINLTHRVIVLFLSSLRGDGGEMGRLSDPTSTHLSKSLQHGYLLSHGNLFRLPHKSITLQKLQLPSNCDFNQSQI